MRTFNYQALTKDDELLTGQVAAASAAAALSQLESQGLTVLLIRQADSDAPVAVQPEIQKAAVSEIAGQQILREKLARLLEQRETLGPALSAFAEELPGGRARKDLQRFAKRLQDGATTEELLESRDLVSVWLPLVGSGKLLDSGHLQEVFAEAEREYANSAQVKRALAYPAVVFVLALMVLVLLGLWIVPTFEEIFWDFQMQLPGITDLLLDFSQLLRHKPHLFLLGAIAAYGAFVLLLKAFRRWILPSRWLGLFIDGNSQQVSEMAVFVQHLGEALQAGLPLGDALKLVGGISNHRWLRREALRLANSISKNADQTAALKRSALPATVNYALQAGPQGIANVRLLKALSESYFERVRNRFRWSTGFLPQFALLLVGFVVGCVVIALFLPLVSLINGLTG